MSESSAAVLKGLILVFCCLYFEFLHTAKHILNGYECLRWSQVLKLLVFVFYGNRRLPSLKSVRDGRIRTCGDSKTPRRWSLHCRRLRSRYIRISIFRVKSRQFSVRISEYSWKRIKETASRTRLMNHRYFLEGVTRITLSLWSICLTTGMKRGSCGISVAQRRILLSVTFTVSKLEVNPPRDFSCFRLCREFSFMRQLPGYLSKSWGSYKVGDKLPCFTCLDKDNQTILCSPE